MSAPGAALDGSGAAGAGVEDFRRRARAWLEAAAPDAPPDYGAIVPGELIVAGRAWQRRLVDAGWAGLHWPGRWGGQGLSVEHTTAWVEECARVGVPPFLNMVGLVLTAEGLLQFGTDAQRDTHLPPLLRGDQLWCQLFSEPDAGSDLAHLSTRATPIDDGWLLSGQKVWCSNGRHAQWGICLARTDPQAPAHRGLSFFLVDMRAPGVGTRPLAQMTGASEFDEVHFDDVALPEASLLGQPGQGWAVAMATLTHERNHIGAMAISLERRLERLLEHGGGRSPAGRDRLLSLWCRGRAAVALARQPRLGAVGASLMKLAVAELGFDVAQLQSELAGMAATVDGEAARQLLAAPAARIAGGTTQVQKNILAERVLGLPREPSAG